MAYKQKSPFNRVSPLNQLSTRSNLGGGLVSKMIGGLKSVKNKVVDLATNRSSGLPLPARALINDLSGKRRDLTTEDLSPELKDAYFRAYHAASQREGNTPDSGYIDYGDYSVGANEGGEGMAQQLELLNNPGYQARYTTGKAAYTRNPDGTISISDTFDFNDAGEGLSNEEKKLAIEKELSNIPEGNVKDRARVYARYYGSGPGEGAKVNFNINPETDEMDVPLSERTLDNPWVKVAKGAVNLYNRFTG